MDSFVPQKNKIDLFSCGFSVIASWDLTDRVIRNVSLWAWFIDYIRNWRELWDSNRQKFRWPSHFVVQDYLKYNNKLQQYKTVEIGNFLIPNNTWRIVFHGHLPIKESIRMISQLFRPTLSMIEPLLSVWLEGRSILVSVICRCHQRTFKRVLNKYGNVLP